MDLARRLFARANEFYVPAAERGILQVQMVGSPELDHHFVLDTTLEMKPGVTEAADAHVALSRTMLDFVLANPTTFEPRATPYSRSIRTSGNTRLVNHFAQFLKRPDARTAALVERMDQETFPAPRVVDYEGGVEQARILHHLSRNEPLHVRDPIPAARDDWSAQRVRERFGPLPLRRNGATGEIQTVGSFVDAFNDPRAARIYSDGCEVPAPMLELLSNGWFDRRDFVATRLWFGRRRQDKVITRLHRDFQVSFLTHLFGDKRVRLYTPNRARNLQAYPTFNTYQICAFNPTIPECIPGMDQIPFVDVELRAGDTLVIPACWFHCVWAETDVLSISQFMTLETVERLSTSLAQR